MHGRSWFTRGACLRLDNMRNAPRCLPSPLSLLGQANLVLTVAQDTKFSCRAYVMQNVLGLVDLLDQ